MTTPKRAPAVEPEWILTDADSIRRAIRGGMAKRRINQTYLSAHMGNSTSVLSNILGGKTDHLRSDTLLKTFAAMGFEVVIREPRTKASQRRLDALKEERRQREAASEPAEDTGIDPDDPEAELKERLLGSMIDPKLRADLIEVFKQVRTS